MKALSGYAEWFWLIAKNYKEVENRPWSLSAKIDLPMRIYLHASKTKTPADELVFIRRVLTAPQLAEFNDVNWDKYRGAIIGEATIFLRFREGDESKWYFGPHGFWLKDGVLFEAPVPYRGQLGFFEVNLPEHK